jgi:UDP-glucose 4-epimerase
MRAFITGGAGFIGSNLADRLLADGHSVTVYDNFATGQSSFLDGARLKQNFRLVKGDLLDRDRLKEAVAEHDVVFHLAANADVRHGPDHPGKDLQQNTIATFHVLEAMRANGVRRIAFSSTGSVYGEPEIFPTPENCPVSRADESVRRFQARRRRVEHRLLPGVRIPGLHLPLCFDSGRTVHAWSRV